MTHTDFNHLLTSTKALTPAQVRQLYQRLDSQLIQPKSPSGKGARRAKAAAQQAKKPLTEAELQQHMLEIGLMSQLPDTDADFDDPDDQPIAIKGEPLSETIIRERRSDGGVFLRLQRPGQTPRP
jgi:hypothetical protein